jgi:hypothetical protein
MSLYELRIVDPLITSVLGIRWVGVTRTVCDNTFGSKEGIVACKELSGVGYLPAY